MRVVGPSALSVLTATIRSPIEIMGRAAGGIGSTYVLAAGLAAFERMASRIACQVLLAWLG